MKGSRLLAYLPALAFALYPLSLTLAGNVGMLPIGTADVLRAAAGALIPVVCVLLVLAALTRGRAAGGLWLALVLALFVSYGLVFASGALFAGADREAWPGALRYTIASVLIGTLLMRPWDHRPRDPVPLAILASAMLAINLFTAAWQWPVHEERWSAAAQIIATPPPRVAGGTADGRTSASPARTAPAPRRDIYYIVLDGFGRPDILQQLYGVDLTPLVSSLHARGFYIPERARSNYAQTYFSLASTLNLNYVDALAPVVGPSSVDRRPLHRMIRRNTLMTLAREAGYTVAVVSSDYSATLAFDEADRCACEQYGLSEIEQAALSTTPLAALPLQAWTHDAHRRKVLASLQAIERPLPDGVRTFTFAHVIAPHPPFVFAADGSARTPPQTLLGLADGDHFKGRPLEYIEGYRGQVQFMAERVRHLVDVLLSRPGPKPAIVIHGDHGPGSRLRWEDPAASSMDERFGIFAAYYLPDDPPADSGSGALRRLNPREPLEPLYSTMTPVNGARALASRYLGVQAPFLPDESRFGTWSHPYDLIPVPHETAAGPVGR